MQDMSESYVTTTYFTAYFTFAEGFASITYQLKYLKICRKIASTYVAILYSLRSAVTTVTSIREGIV
jgi:hypothetical protein